MNILKAFVWSTPFVLFLSCLQGSILIEDGLGSLPNLDVETYAIDGGISSTRAGSKDNRDNTQSFTLSSGLLADQFVLSVNSALEGATVTFRLFEVTSSATATTLLLGTELLSEAYTFTAADATVTTNQDPVTEDNLLTWDIPDTMLSAGAYALQIDGPSSGPASGVYVGWRATGTNPYAGGALYRDGLGEAFEGTQDQTLGIVAVPEPGSLALLGMAGLSLMLWKRRSLVQR